MGLTYISSVTASASATVSFTTGIDSTYNEYQFHFVNMHPATNSVHFQFQVNAVGQTGFNETITSSTFFALHNEDNLYTYLLYRTGSDQAQGTAYQRLVEHIGGASGMDDSSVSGVLTLYAPSDTTYVKHFISRASGMFNASPRAEDFYAAGYVNTTSAIDEISFQFSSGNIDAGTIHMYGVG